MHLSQSNHFLFDKGMRREEGGIVSLGGILLTRIADKIEHFGTPLIRIGQGWRGFGGNDENGPEGIEIAVWRNAFGHFNTGNAQGPYIGTAIVVRFANDFGCHPVRRSHDSFALIECIGQFGADSEIR